MSYGINQLDIQICLVLRIVIAKIYANKSTLNNAPLEVMHSNNGIDGIEHLGSRPGTKLLTNNELLISKVFQSRKRK